MSRRIRVLFLAANPSTTASLRLDEEARTITESIRLGRERDRFDFHTAWAVRTRDLQATLLQFEPHILHFSGHASADGILLEDDTGASRCVEGETLCELLGILRNHLRVVMLNACNTRATMQSFHEVIDYSIGMSSPISDRAAIVFAGAFYRSLAFARDVPTAFRLAVNQLKLEGIPESGVPQLLEREGAVCDALISRRVPRRREPSLASISVHDDGSVGAVNVIKELDVMIINPAKPRRD